MASHREQYLNWEGTFSTILLHGHILRLNNYSNVFPEPILKPYKILPEWFNYANRQKDNLYMIYGKTVMLLQCY